MSVKIYCYPDENDIIDLSTERRLKDGGGQTKRFLKRLTKKRPEL